MLIKIVGIKSCPQYEQALILANNFSSSTTSQASEVFLVEHEEYKSDLEYNQWKTRHILSKDIYHESGPLIFLMESEMEHLIGGYLQFVEFVQSHHHQEQSTSSWKRSNHSTTNNMVILLLCIVGCVCLYSVIVFEISVTRDYWIRESGQKVETVETTIDSTNNRIAMIKNKIDATLSSTMLHSDAEENESNKPTTKATFGEGDEQGDDFNKGEQITMLQSSESNGNHKPLSPSYQAIGKENANRIFAIGDLHGDYECAVHWVTKTELIDGDLADLESRHSWEWSADNSAYLVFMGDYIDRGTKSFLTLQLVKALTETFPDNVFAIMGNHELEFLMDRKRVEKDWIFHQIDYATASPYEYLNWIPSVGLKYDKAKEAMDMLYDLLRDKVYGGVRNINYWKISPQGPEDSITMLIEDKQERRFVSDQIKLLQANYLSSIGSNTDLGKWLEKRPVVVTIDKLLFVHGGINHELWNNKFGRDINLKSLKEMNQHLLDNSNEEKLSEFIATKDEGKMIYGLVTYKKLHKEDCIEVKKVTALLQVEKILVGHVPQEKVTLSCGGKLAAVDSKLSRWIRANGNAYCRGDKEEVSSDFTCRAITKDCKGDILLLLRGEDEEWKAYGIW